MLQDFSALQFVSLQLVRLGVMFSICGVWSSESFLFVKGEIY